LEFTDLCCYWIFSLQAGKGNRKMKKKLIELREVG
jgi:hypothetical protein